MPIPNEVMYIYQLLGGLLQLLDLLKKEPFFKFLLEKLENNINFSL